MSELIWNALAVIAAIPGAVLIWRGIREQQEREDRQAREDSGII